ncbi:hypothetical protein F0U59_14515 [Archangium gephyra]|nr:hypothetical protein F0U59_14515 [Archangium gephyra]
MASTTRIIEGTWNCGSCEAKGILARHRHCPTCGDPREETGGESRFDVGPTDAATGRSVRESVTGPELLKAAEAGADWTCGHCGATNRADAPRCGNCRAERASGGRTQATEERGGWVCEVCGTSNGGKSGACSRCYEMAPGIPAPRAKPLSAFWRRLPVANPLALRTRVEQAIPVLVLLGLVGLIVGPLVWGSLENEVKGEVVAMEWRHLVRRETFEKVARRGWRDELKPAPARMPVNGRGEVAGVEAVRDCEQLQRGSRRVEDGYETKCETRFIHDRKTRVCEQVPRYREEPIYAEQCGYDTWVWKKVEQLEAKGRDDTPRWPEGNLVAGPLDRVHRLAAYTARIQYSKGGKSREYEYLLPNEARFHAMRKGQSVTLQVRNDGAVLGVLQTGSRD